MAKTCKQCSAPAVPNGPWCVKHRNDYHTAYRRAHREETAARTARLVEVKRAYVLEYLRQHPCVDCGETDPVVLDFDHDVSNNDKLHHVATILRGTYSLERVVAEVAKCTVRCANCHRRKTARERGFWKVQQG